MRKLITMSRGVAMLLLPLAACMADVESTDEDIRGLEQALSEQTSVANHLVDSCPCPNVTISFDTSSALLGYDYRRLHAGGPTYCDPTGMPLIHGLNLTSGEDRQLLATTTCGTAATDLRSDGTHVYYLRQSLDRPTEIHRLHVGSGRDSVFAYERGTSLAQDAENVYWTTASWLRKKRKNGWLASSLVVAPSGHVLKVLGSDATSVYFDDADAAGQHQLRRVNRNGGGLRTLAVLGAGRALDGFSQDATRVYWSERVSGGAGSSLRRVNKDGTGATELLSSATQVYRQIAVTADKLYWLREGGSTTDIIFSRRESGEVEQETRDYSGLNSAYLMGQAELPIVGGAMYWPHTAFSGSFFIGINRGFLAPLI